MEGVMHTNWCYRSEGNCNMLFSNRKLRRVYRILKVDVNGGRRHRNQHMHEGTSDAMQSQYMTLVQYNACVMERLYLNYMSVPRIKSVTIPFLKDISLGINNKRPENRLGKEISLCPTVLDMPDYAFLPSPCHDDTSPSFMFELKAGSVARTYHNISSEQPYTDSLPSCSRTQPLCYFCINKSLDHEHKAQRINRYCPQELFSGDMKRMRKCVKYLLDDIACPGNRLRLFKDGVDITTGIQGVDDIITLLSSYFQSNSKSEILNEIIDLLIKCLIYSKPSTSTQNSLAASHCRASQQTLPNACILSIFANAQYYGAGTIEEVHIAYNKLKYYIAQDPTAASKLCIDGPYDTGLWRLSGRPERPTDLPEDVFAAFIVVRNYLIYRTAKDASLLITFQPKRRDLNFDCDENSTMFRISELLGHHDYACNAAIIDLDFKSYSKMDAYMDKEWAIFDLLVKHKQ